MNFVVRMGVFRAKNGFAGDRAQKGSLVGRGYGLDLWLNYEINPSNDDSMSVEIEDRLDL